MKNLQPNNNETPIENYAWLHMFAYFPDDCIQVQKTFASFVIV